MLRTITCVALTLFLSCPGSAQEPWAIMTGQSVIECRAGLRHIYQRLGRKDLVAALDSAAVTNLVSGNLKGLDLHRPLGCLILPDQYGIGQVITFIPITGEQAFIEFLERHQLKVNQGENNVLTLHVPLLGKVYFHFQKNYAMFALSPDVQKLAIPQIPELIPESHRKVQLAATIYLDRLPADQRQQWLTRGQQGLKWLLPDASKSHGEIAESLALSASGFLLKRVADDSKEITILAQADRVADRLWGMLILTPRADVAWLAEVKNYSANSVRIEIPAKLWAKLRGKSENTAALAAKSAFKRPDEDKLLLSMQGGDKLQLRAELSGAMLAYHAALNQEESQPRQRERSRDRRRIRPSR